MWSHRPAAARRSSARSCAESSDNSMRGELTELRSELARAQATLQALNLRSNASSATGGSTTEVPQPAPAIETEPPPLPVRLEDQREILDARFNAEVTDRSWEREARQLVEKQLGSFVPDGSRLVSIDCRASLCRAEVRHPDMASHQQLIRDAFASGTTSWPGATLASYREPQRQNDPVISVLFFGRDGSDFADEQAM
jgi:hypothetical protein